ncbi:hypothetical protein [Haloprofundus sp. MHR1]|uniref:hypothetical protein n=1 Tax=Haloprofundus sp. MHR1 TaxID=2572921 RepID=UPI0010BE1E89|nr:hypothetical protein [Haloprofundus sp. MHR1]QCJ47216.1 hypothetical protein FCF25_08835 [Haloprofundus sp. MHR1]
MERSLRGWLREIEFVFYGILLIILLVVALLGVALFLFLYSLAMIGPFLGRFFDVDDRIRIIIDRIVGIEDIHRFRADVRDIVAKWTNQLDSKRSKIVLRRDIRQVQAEAKADSQDGDFLLAIISGGISTVAQAIYPISLLAWWVGVYAFLSTIAIAFRVVIIDILAYGGSKSDRGIIDQASKPDLVLMDGWNQGILFSSKAQAGILIVGFFVGIKSDGYELGKELLDEILRNEWTKLEAWAFIGSVMYWTMHHNFWGKSDGFEEETDVNG